jgi:spore coat-associated protein N
MGIKKKLGLGAMSAVMGLSLIGTGTWAAFNDIEKVDAKFAAGTLDLSLEAIENNPYSFEVSNLKPGDKMTRTVKLTNNSSLAIENVLLSIDNITFDDYGFEGENRDTSEYDGDDNDIYGKNTAYDYLDQFKVKVVSVGDQGGDNFPIDVILQDITLAELYAATATTPNATGAQITAAKAKLSDTTYVQSGYYIDGRLNVVPLPDSYANASNKQYAGVPVGVRHHLKIEIEFDNNTNKANGVYDQNKFQGDTADVNFTLESTQWEGQEITDTDMNGTDVKTNRQAENGAYN